MRTFYRLFGPDYDQALNSGPYCKAFFDEGRVQSRSSTEGRISAKTPNFCVFLGFQWQKFCTFLKSIIILEK